ncbi:mutator type transposase, partial [Tanacetum coccineum]
MSWFMRCLWCGGPCNGRNCRRCTNVSFEDKFVRNPDLISYDETPDFSYPPPQPQTYSCELCGNDSHYGFDCPSRFPLCQPRNQNYFESNPCYNPNSYGFDQPTQTSIDHQPPKEISVRELLLQEKLHKALQAVCEKLNQQEQAANVSTYTPEPLRRFNFIYDNDEESTILLNEIISQIPPSIKITPVLPTMEPEDSLIMGDENLSTIPEKESDEFIKSSVEDLVPIPSESEDTSDSDKECDLPFCDNSVTFSNPLFDANDDECFNPGGDIDEIVKMIEDDAKIENEIIEPDVDVHLYVPFDNICVTSLLLEEVLEGEDVDVVNVNGFDSDTSCENVVDAKEAKDIVYLHSIKSRRNSKLFKNDKIMIFDKVRVNPNIPVKAVQDHLQCDLELQASMSKAFIADAKAEREVRGDHSLQYSMLRDYVVELQSTTSNTTIKIADERNSDLSLPIRVFKRIYVCLGLLKEGFMSCRRELLGLNGAFLKGPFQSLVFSSVGLDLNNEIYPLAYAFVEVESKSSWYWFLQCLGGDIDLQPNSNFTFISDRQKGIISTIKAVFSSEKHIFCVKHIYENIKQRWSRQAYKDLLQRYGSATTVIVTSGNSRNFKG